MKELEIIKRFNAETPVFWKKAQKAALSLGGSATAVIVANAHLTLNLPGTLITVLSYTIAVCAAVAGTAQFTRKDAA